MAADGSAVTPERIIEVERTVEVPVEVTVEKVVTKEVSVPVEVEKIVTVEIERVVTVERTVQEIVEIEPPVPCQESDHEYLVVLVEKFRAFEPFADTSPDQSVIDQMFQHISDLYRVEVSPTCIEPFRALVRWMTKEFLSAQELASKGPLTISLVPSRFGEKSARIAAEISIDEALLSIGRFPELRGGR